LLIDGAFDGGGAYAKVEPIKLSTRGSPKQRHGNTDLRLAQISRLRETCVERRALNAFEQLEKSAFVMLDFGIASSSLQRGSCAMKHGCGMFSDIVPVDVYGIHAMNARN
jgi:hypothetical protein